MSFEEWWKSKGFDSYSGCDYAQEAWEAQQERIDSLTSMLAEQDEDMGSMADEIQTLEEERAKGYIDGFKVGQQMMVETGAHF